MESLKRDINPVPATVVDAVNYIQRDLTFFIAK